MSKALITAEVNLNERNLNELRENEKKLSESLVDDVRGAISWYGDPKARVKRLNVTLGPDSAVPMGLSKATATALKELPAQQRGQWVIYLLEELDDGSDEGREVLDRVYGSLTRRTWLGAW